MKYLYILIVLCLSSYSGFSQVGIGTTTPDNSSALDITSAERGLLIPRMTQAQRDGIVNPATGLLIFQTDGDDDFYYYDGFQWTKLGSGGIWKLEGNSGTDDTNNKLGTADFQDFIIATNGTEAFRISADFPRRIIKGICEMFG